MATKKLLISNSVLFFNFICKDKIRTICNKHEKRSPVGMKRRLNYDSPNIKKRVKFSEEEAEAINRGVMKYGNQWTKVRDSSPVLSKRTPQQCKVRISHVDIINLYEQIQEASYFVSHLCSIFNC